MSGDVRPGYVRVDGAAAYLGVPPRLIRRLVAERRIPHAKIGKYLVFSYDDLDGWVATNRRDAVAS
jgi:excisionase family DNA binding protein